MHKKQLIHFALNMLIAFAALSLAIPAQAQIEFTAGQRALAGGQSAHNQPVLSIATTTPNADGSITHIIKYGETLIDIAEAYGVPLNELIAMNRLDPNNPAYFEGQVLIIRAAFTPTPFITTTYTPRPPTRTPLPTRTPRPTRTATPELSPTPTRTATHPALIRVPTLEEVGTARPILAYAAFAISLAALAALIASFIPKDKNK